MGMVELVVIRRETANRRRVAVAVAVVRADHRGGIYVRVGGGVIFFCYV